mgnify:FL=1
MNERHMKGYRGSSALKKVNTIIEWTPELIEEYIQCSQDPFYFAERHMSIINVDRGKIKIKLYDYQREIIQSALDNRRTVAECARQSGKTTAITVFVLWYILFNKDKTVAILANKAETAREILSRIQLAYENLPKWLQQGVVEWNKGKFELENGSRVIAGATTSSNFRGYAINMLIIDEAAFIEGWEDFFTSVFPTITSGVTTKIVLISTVNGLNHFWEITKLARLKDTEDHKNWNGYHLISVPWTRVPGRDEKWHKETLAGLNFNHERFSQEYENRYLGSSGTLIAGWKLETMNPVLPIVPKSAGISMWEHPIPGHMYIGVADVSRGKLLDYSTLQMIDVTQMPYRQVLTFRDNMTTPGDFAEIISVIGKKFNHAAIMIEINDIGGQTADALYFDYEYENVLFTENAGKMGKRITASYTMGKTDRGIRTTKTVKGTGCALLKLLIEQDQLLISDKETIYELSTFSRKNDTYKAEEGKHDDLVMPLVLFAWLTQTKFFKDVTDLNTIVALRDHSDEQIMNELTPFGFIDDGQQDVAEVHQNDVWINVSQDTYLFER